MRLINYSTEPPKNFEELLVIYEALGWNSLNLGVAQLEKMCSGSWHTLYAYHEQKLIGMVRVISDGIITGVICGLCVLPAFRSLGIGRQLVTSAVKYCEKHGVIPQLMCEEQLESYYLSLGFKRFSIGMSKYKEG